MHLYVHLVSQPLASLLTIIQFADSIHAEHIRDGHDASRNKSIAPEKSLMPDIIRN